jgi:hypothetical protein
MTTDACVSELPRGDEITNSHSVLMRSITSGARIPWRPLSRTTVTQRRYRFFGDNLSATRFKQPSNQHFSEHKSCTQATIKFVCWMLQLMKYQNGGAVPET